jgi:hypothetical protein
MTVVSEVPPLTVSPSSLYELTGLIERSVGMLEVGFKPQSETPSRYNTKVREPLQWHCGTKERR